tara:strand:- start:868 stop:1164 length:297 start_codon:yes stop_codon:yes gene_type:complete
MNKPLTHRHSTTNSGLRFCRFTTTIGQTNHGHHDIANQLVEESMVVPYHRTHLIEIMIELLKMNTNSTLLAALPSQSSEPVKIRNQYTDRFDLSWPSN